MADAETFEVMAIGVGNVGQEAVSPDRLTRLASDLGYSAVELITLNSHPEKVQENEKLLKGLSEASIGLRIEGTADDYWQSHEPDLVLVTTPSGIGKESNRYISHFLGDDPENSEGPAVVTAEKGAVTEFWESLQPFVDKKLGIVATVGGGTQLMRAARAQLKGSGASRIDLVVNGTLGFGMQSLQNGMAADEVARQADLLGYAEPGATSVFDIFKGEIGDIVKKAQIFYNYVLADGSDYISNQVISVPDLLEEDMNKLVTSESSRRMVVTFESTDTEATYEEEDKNRMAYLRQELPGGWVLKLGFVEPSEDPVLSAKLPDGVDAGYVIRAGGGSGKDGIYVHSGPGAGPAATANAMHADARRLLTKQ